MSRTRSASVLASPARNEPDQGEKRRVDRQVRSRRWRHRLRRGPDRPAHRADQRTHRASPHAPQGPSLAPRPADAGRQAPPHAALPRAPRPRALPRPGRRTRPAAMIAAGQPAPEFTLRNQDGEKVSLSDLRGKKVLLVFYPLDFSPVCSDQLSVYQEVKPEIEAKGVTMVGISVDSGFAHKAFQEKLGIDTQLLADFEPKGAVARAYGAYIEERGHNNRSLVLVDEQGTVEWAHESPTPLEIPGANLIFDALASTNR